MRYWFSVLFLLAAANIGFAQVTLKATVTTRSPRLGETFRVVFVLENGDAEDFSAPSLDGLSIVAGPAISSSYTVVNGRASSSQRYSFDLRAVREGEASVGAASVVVDGDRVSSRPLQISVRAALNATTPELSGDRVAEALIDVMRDTVYVGEPVTTRVRLLSREQLYSYEVKRALSFGQFRRASVRQFDSRPSSIDINGASYIAKTIEEYTAYPTRRGRHSIGPVSLRAFVLTGSRRGLFGRAPTRAIDVSSNVVELTVLPLPPGAPDGFTGASGRWKFAAQFGDAERVSTADAITYKLFIQGRGDATRLQAPDLTWPDGWRSYPPETTLDRSVESDTGVVHTRVYEYSVVPTRGGTFELAPQASSFDTELGRYISWTPEPVRLEVADLGPSKQASTGMPDADQGPLPINTTTPQVVRHIDLLEEPLYWLSWLGIPFLIGGIVVSRRAWNARQSRQDPAGHDPVAEGRRRLRSARAQLDDPPNFYAEVRVALEKYAEDHLGLVPSQQDESSLRAAFAKTNRDDAYPDRFLEARALADRGLYGGGTDEAGRRAALQELEILLS